MTSRAQGEFEVRMTPQDTPAEGGAPSVTRMLLDKTFSGDLEATSKGQMLAATSQVDGSAGYVAMEAVTGTLHGRQGSFVLQHSGTMRRGEPALILGVVPDSGTAGLAGLRGEMSIEVVDGDHSYDFTFDLADRD